MSTLCADQLQSDFSTPHRLEGSRDTPENPHSFCANELQQALAEESSVSSIASFRLTSSEPLGATASVALLEGSTIRIHLTTNGYSVILADHQRPQEQVFETIGQILSSVSSMYEQRRQEVLIEALERVCSN
ncbi:hypothetical protein R3P38DRAFT_2869656 [Favolaschia claudopus]|uniref:GSKIP domain-containing protein n=1 Tax=Favolaschia claudopus TaxID=2862362 RepID=A0AAW0DC70_9AGAR